MKGAVEVRDDICDNVLSTAMDKIYLDWEMVT